MPNESWPEINRSRLEAVFQSDAYVDELGAKLVEWDGGRAVYRLAPEQRHLNFVGSLHGGVLFSLADYRRGQRPMNVGLRFSWKAVIPSP